MQIFRIMFLSALVALILPSPGYAASEILDRLRPKPRPTPTMPTTPVEEEPVIDGFHTITSTKLAERTLACTDCLNWKLIGECNWAKCIPFPPACKFQATPKVTHFIPDVIVTTYSSKFPISDIAKVLPAVNVEPGTMARTNQGREDDLTFKHATIFGNPALLGYKAMNSAGGWMCESVVKVPWQPFFQSETDPLWGRPLVEMLYPETVLGRPKIDADLPLGGWGQVFPRTGYLVHPYDAITGAVAAHRAADIVTRGLSVHVAVQLGNDCGNKCWPPGVITANDKSTHRFQSLFPIYERSATVFGGDAAAWVTNGSNLATALTGQSKARDKYNQQAYVYALWRPYKCCQEKGMYLGSIDWD